MTIDMEAARVRQQFDIAYAELLAQFVSISKPHLTARVLDELKDKYSDVINSTRTLEYIKTVEALLKILEKRGAISYSNVEVLRYISSTYVRDPVLERMLASYEGQSRPQLPPHNLYLAQTGKYTRNRQAESKSTNCNSVPNVRCTEIANKRIERAEIYPPLSRTSTEDFTTLKTHTETPVENIEVCALLEERRNLENRRVLFFKTRHKYCSTYCTSALVAFAGLALLVALICVSNLMSVESPVDAHQFEVRPGPSRYDAAYQNATRTQEPPVQVTMYSTQPTFQITLPGSLYTETGNRGTRNSETEVMTMVLQEISEKLGRHWRDVARYLRVTEYDIDEIQSQLNLTLREKALKALLIFQSKCDPLQWKPRLKQALDKARRRDLMDMVDELASRQF